MNTFQKISGTRSVKNDQGVVVSLHSYDRESGGNISYEVNGIKYFIPYDHNADIELLHARLDGQFGSQLPEKIIERMREDLPKALVALESKLEFGFTRIPNTYCLTNGFGVVVDFGYTSHSVSYEVDGVKYEINDFDSEMAGFYSHEREVDMSNIWLAGKGSESRSQVPKYILDKMMQDLPKAYAAFSLKFKFKN